MVRHDLKIEHFVAEFSLESTKQLFNPFFNTVDENPYLSV